jgi:hypothetical protein
MLRRVSICILAERLAADSLHQDRNCEDILMSFIYARYTRRPPLFLDAPFQDIGLRDVSPRGISHQPYHIQHRTECVQKFQKLFGQDTLISTSISVKAY